MITKDCVLVTGNWTVPSTGNVVAAGTYLSPGDATLQTVPPTLQLDECTPHPVVPVIFFFLFMMVS